jgi:hypothetical protein
MSNEQVPMIEQSSGFANAIETVKNNGLRLGVLGALTAVTCVGVYAASQGGEEMPAYAEADGSGVDDKCSTVITTPNGEPVVDPITGDPVTGECPTTTTSLPETTTTTTSLPETTTTTSIPETSTTTTVLATTTTSSLPAPTTSTTTTSIAAPGLVGFCELGDFDGDGDKDIEFVKIPAGDAIIGVHFAVDAPECEDVEPPVIITPPVVAPPALIPQVTE